MMDNPEDWEIYVHENLGWFSRLIHKHLPDSISVSPGYNNEPRYQAMLSLGRGSGIGDCRWTDGESFTHPQLAVDHVIKKARAVITKEQKAFSVIEKGTK